MNLREHLVNQGVVLLDMEDALSTAEGVLLALIAHTEEHEAFAVRTIAELTAARDIVALMAME